MAKFYVSELIKYNGEDCVILEINEKDFSCEILKIDDGKCLHAKMDEIEKSNIETLDFEAYFGEEPDAIPKEDNEMMFDLGIDMFEEEHSPTNYIPVEHNYAKPYISTNLSEELKVPKQKEEVVKTESSFESKKFKELTVEELDEIANGNTEATTKSTTKWAVRQFKAWLIERHQSEEFEYFEEEKLAACLRQFYGEVCTSDGKEYSKSSLIGLRAGINRHIQGPPYNKNCNIVTDKCFVSANKILTGRVKCNRRKGIDISHSKPAIASGDINKMYSCGILSLESPEALQNKVFFELALHFGRRGREGWKNLKKSSFVFFRDDENTNIEYATLNYNEVSKKNHGMEHIREKDQRMYSNPGDLNCPVRSLRMYLNKLSQKYDDFFQQPRKGLKVSDEDIWYIRPMGVNHIDNMMKKISLKAGLSRVYTNHSIRATTSTVLSDSGIDHNDIISVTGHKDIKSLEPYIGSTCNKKRKQMSSILNSFGKIKNEPSNTEGQNHTSEVSDNTIKNEFSPNECPSRPNSVEDMPSGIFSGTHIQGGSFTFNFNYSGSK